MTERGLTKSVVEQAGLAWLEASGWHIAHGPDIAPYTLNAERTDYGQVVLERRLCDAVARLNQSPPAEALNDVSSRPTRAERHFAGTRWCWLPLESADAQPDQPGHPREGCGTEQRRAWL